MTITVQPMDASVGAPAYSASNERQALAALLGGGSPNPLGARSGLRVGTPADIITVTSTTWTASKPFAAVISPDFQTTQGAYRWAYDASPVVSDAITAADGTNPRKDALYIKVNDASAGDGSGVRSAPIMYLAGQPNPTPALPAIPAGALLVGTIDVPKVGGGSPTFTLNQQYFVAAGGALPVASVADRDALAKYPSLEVIRLDAGCSREVWDGAAWRGGAAHVEFTGDSGPSYPTSANQLWGVGALTKDDTNTINGAGVTSPGNDAITLPGPAVWTLIARVRTNKPATTMGNTWLSVRDAPAGAELTSGDVAGATANATASIIVTGASKTIYLRFQSDQTGYILTSRIILDRQW